MSSPLREANPISWLMSTGWPSRTVEVSLAGMKRIRRENDIADNMTFNMLRTRRNKDRNTEKCQADCWYCSDLQRCLRHRHEWSLYPYPIAEWGFGMSCSVLVNSHHGTRPHLTDMATNSSEECTIFYSKVVYANMILTALSGHDFCREIWTKAWINRWVTANMVYNWGVDLKLHYATDIPSTCSIDLDWFTEIKRGGGWIVFSSTTLRKDQSYM